MSDFMPKDEPGLADWFDNWSIKMDNHGAEHGFSAAEIGQSKDDAMIVRNIVSGWQAIEAYRSKFCNFKHIMLYGEKDEPTPAYPSFDLPAIPAAPVAMLAGIVKRTRSAVRRLRESKNFNEAVAADFRVLAVRSVGFSETDAKPALKPQASAASQIDIPFTKNNFDGLDLEMQRGTAVNEWIALGRFYASPAEDTAPPVASGTPEVRRYRARYLKGNKPVGLYSDIVSVITNP